MEKTRHSLTLSDHQSPVSDHSSQLPQPDSFPALQRGFDFWHEQLRLRWQMRSDGVEGPGFVPCQQRLDGAFAGVVRRQCQPPIIEMAVQKAKVFGCGPGAG